MWPRHLTISRSRGRNVVDELTRSTLRGIDHRPSMFEEMTRLRRRNEAMRIREARYSRDARPSLYVNNHIFSYWHLANERRTNNCDWVENETTDVMLRNERTNAYKSPISCDTAIVDSLHRRVPLVLFQIFYLNREPRNTTKAYINSNRNINEI